MLRSGVIAKKVGMTRLFMDDGKQIPATVLQLDKLQVVAKRTAEKDGYSAVQLGAGVAKAKRTSQAMRGHFAAAKVEPKRKIAEFRVDPENLIDHIARSYTSCIDQDGVRSSRERRGLARPVETVAVFQFMRHDSNTARPRETVFRILCTPIGAFLGCDARAGGLFEHLLVAALQ